MKIKMFRNWYIINNWAELQNIIMLEYNERNNII